MKPMFDDVRAKRMADALSECITASDARLGGFLSVRNKKSPVRTALKTLASLRLVERYSNGWMVTNIGRCVANAWKPGTVA